MSKSEVPPFYERTCPMLGRECILEGCAFYISKNHFVYENDEFKRVALMPACMIRESCLKNLGFDMQSE